MASTNTNSDVDREKESVTIGELLARWRDRETLMASTTGADRTLMMQEQSADYDKILTRCRGMLSQVRCYEADAVALYRSTMAPALAPASKIQLLGRIEEIIRNRMAPGRAASTPPLKALTSIESIVSDSPNEGGTSSAPSSPSKAGNIRTIIASTNTISDDDREEETLSIAEMLTRWRGLAALMASANDADQALMVNQLREEIDYDEELGGCRIREADLEKEVDAFMEVSSLVRDDPENAVELFRVQMASAAATDNEIRWRGREQELVDYQIHLSRHREEVVQMLRNNSGLTSDPPPPPQSMAAVLERQIAQCDEMHAQCDELLFDSRGYEESASYRSNIQRRSYVIERRDDVIQLRGRKAEQLMRLKSSVSESAINGLESWPAWMIRVLESEWDWDEEEENLVFNGLQGLRGLITIYIEETYWETLKKEDIDVEPNSPFFEFFTNPRKAPLMKQYYVDNPDLLGLMAMLNLMLTRPLPSGSFKYPTSSLAIRPLMFVMLKYLEANPRYFEMCDDPVWLDHTMGMVQNSRMMQHVVELMRDPQTSMGLRELSEIVWTADKYSDPPPPPRVHGSSVSESSNDNGAVAIHKMFIADAATLAEVVAGIDDVSSDDDDDNNNNDCVTTEQATRRSTSREFLSPNSITSVLPTQLSMKQRPSSSSTVDVTINDTSPDGDKNNGEQRQPPQTTSGNASVFPSSPSSPSSTSSFYSALGSPLPSPDEDVDEDNRNVVTGTAVQNLEDPPVETATTGPEECARCLQYGETVQQALWCRKKSFLCFKFGEHGDTLLRCPLCLQNGTVREAHCCEGRFRLSLCVKFYQHPLEDPQDAAPRVEARTSPDRTMMDANATIATISAASAIVVRASDATGQSTSRELIYPDSNASLSPSQLSTKQCSSSSSTVDVTRSTPNNQRSDTKSSNTSKDDDAGNVHSRKADKNNDGAGNVDDSTPLGHKKREGSKFHGSFGNNVGKLLQQQKTTTMLADTRGSGDYRPKRPQSGPLLPKTLSLTPYAPSLLTAQGQESGAHSSCPSSISSARDVEHQYVSSPTALLGSGSIGTKVGREQSQQGEIVDIAEVQIVGLNQMTTKEKTIQDDEETVRSDDASKKGKEDEPSIEREPVAAVPINQENHNKTYEPHAKKGQGSFPRDTIKSYGTLKSSQEDASKDGYFADHEDMLCDEDNLVDKKSGGKDDAPQVNDVSSTPKNARHHQNSPKQDVQDQTKDATRHIDPVTLPSSITTAKSTAYNHLSDMTDFFSSPDKSDSDFTIKCLKPAQVNNSSAVESEYSSTPAQLNRNPFNDDDYTIKLGRSLTNATAPSLAMFRKIKPVNHQFSDAGSFPTHVRLNTSRSTVDKNKIVDHQFSDAESFSADARLKTSSNTIGSENVSVATVQSGSVDVSFATPHSGFIGIESMTLNLRDGISNDHTDSNFLPETKAPPGTKNSLEKKKPPVSQKQTQCSHPREVSHNVRAWRNRDGNNGYMSMDSQTTESSVSYQNVGPTGLSEMTRICPSSFLSDPLQNRRNNTAQTSYRAREQQQEHQQHRSSF